MTTTEPHGTQHAAGKEIQKETVDKSDDEWKTLAPYKIHDAKSDTFKALYEASCHCGRVKYQLSRKKPLDAKFCHCRTCQTLHGAPFQWAAIFHKEDISFIHGHDDLVWYESGDKILEHRLPCKISCAYCRTPIMDEGRNMCLLFPTLIDFKSREEKRLFDPTCHIFYGSRVVDILDGKPKWSGINEHSKRLEENPRKEEDEKSSEEPAKI